MLFNRTGRQPIKNRQNEGRHVFVNVSFQPRGVICLFNTKLACYFAVKIEKLKNNKKFLQARTLHRASRAI